MQAQIKERILAVLIQLQVFQNAELQELVLVVVPDDHLTDCKFEKAARSW
jgi:hypothetical protein